MSNITVTEHPQPDRHAFREAGVPNDRPSPAWTALRYFGLYRLILSGFFTVIVWTGQLPPPLGEHDPGVFAAAVCAYLLFAILAQIGVEIRPHRFGAHVLGQVLTDIVMLTAMMYASGGVTSGMGMLLLISIALGSMLTEGRTAFLFAGAASIAVLCEEAYFWLYGNALTANYTQAGFLGSTFFATALLGHALAGRLRASEALAARRGADVAHLERLNEQIVQRLRSGIVVLDATGRVRLVNESAQVLLGLAQPVPVAPQPLAMLAWDLAQQLDSWPSHAPPSQILRTASRGTDLLVSRAELGSGPAAATLVFIEDAAAMRQRAQQLKLASLGRLTASIAHEIRNPLGAISHAAQLLSESNGHTAEDRYVTRIIKGHSERVNRIIENVLTIGRRDRSAPEIFAAKPWLEGFVSEFTARMQLPSERVLVHTEPEDIEIVMDRSQLHQVLWNLCENGLRYSQGTPALELRCGVKPISETPFLDVIDHGTGIPEDIADSIFEPFVSKNSPGSGLGLYLASELCECNQAALSLHENSASGCCFRISFAHPQRQQWIA
ncbi:MAG: ATP-binding protein [Pseudomonadota bacterium]|nr:ATP-binding protein [Pseudomonadota bacterium]